MFYVSPIQDVQFELVSDFDEFDIRGKSPKKGKKGDVFARSWSDGDSLFCWVWNKWPNPADGGQRGWLANDDGAGEKAVHHFDETAKPPILTLIHVKGSQFGDGADVSIRQRSSRPRR
jgi:hypothetical protein